MSHIKIELLHSTPLKICSHAIRTCWNSFDKGDNGGNKDIELIDRVGNKYKHSSTLEHINFTFFIQGISRAVLQELARHRMASLSVKSTRYTLKELKYIDTIEEEDYELASKFIVLTKNNMVNRASIQALNSLISILKSGVSNDLVKYCIPESFKTDLSWSINLRSLQNFINLRSSRSALWEIQILSKEIMNSIPEEYIYLIKDFYNE